MRLSKYLASCGVSSRRGGEEIIKGGHVRVDGKIVTDVVTNVMGTERIEVGKKTVTPNHLVYYLLNKPTGYTVSLADSHADSLISELVPKKPPVWPVGRLDRETSGLIIMTNDGVLTNRLTHPKFGKEKEYQILTNEPLTEKELSQLQAGIELKDGLFRPDKIEKISNRTYLMTIHEGRNRLIRRSISYFNKEVLELDRIRIENITEASLPCGSYRHLTSAEVKGLKNA